VIPTSPEELVMAKVVDVIGDDNDLHSYAVARADGISGTVTFSLHRSREVWVEDEYPEPGVSVALSNLRKGVRGWRALSARFLRPSDEG
jgi:hypothetical protein